MFRSLAIITYYSFIEIFKSNIMVASLLIGICLNFLAYAASEITYGVPTRIIIDFALASLSLSSVGIAILMGNYLITKEIENKTIFLILSRPVRRSTFFLGRTLGMVLILLLHVISLSAITLFIFKTNGGEVSNLFYYAFFLSFLEAVIILCLVIFFSLFVNNILAVLLTFTVYLSGYFLDGVVQLSYVVKSAYLKHFIYFYSKFVPSLGKLNIKPYVLYDQFLPQGYIQTGVIYGTIYIILFLILGIFIFQRKNLD